MPGAGRGRARRPVPARDRPAREGFIAVNDGGLLRSISNLTNCAHARTRPGDASFLRPQDPRRAGGERAQGEAEPGE